MKKPKGERNSGQNPIFNNAYEFIKHFDVHLKRHGYTEFTRQNYLSSAKHFYAWLQEPSNGVIDISRKIVQQFLYEHLPLCRCPEPVYKDVKTVRAALNQILLTAGHDRIRKSRNSRTFQNIEDEIDVFDNYLENICGHAEATRWYHRRHIREFLLWLFGDQAIRIERITAEQLCKFVSEKAAFLRSSSISV